MKRYYESVIVPYNALNDPDKTNYILFRAKQKKAGYNNYTDAGPFYYDFDSRIFTDFEKFY